MRGEGESCGVSAYKYSWRHGAQINFGDLTSYLTYDVYYPALNQYHVGNSAAIKNVNDTLKVHKREIF